MFYVNCGKFSSHIKISAATFCQNLAACGTSADCKNFVSCFRANPKSNKLAIGRKKFNMDPKKVRITLTVMIHICWSMKSQEDCYEYSCISYNELNSLCTILVLFFNPVIHFCCFFYSTLR